MKLIVFQTSSGAALGVVTSDGVVPLDGSTGGAALTPAALLSEGEPALSRVRAALERSASGASRLQETELQLAPCVYQPGKILAVGLNYRRHAHETGATIPETPILFSKFNNTLAGSCHPVALPRVATQYDYEVELGVVIGRRASAVPAARPDAARRLPTAPASRSRQRRPPATRFPGGAAPARAPRRRAP